MLVFEDAHLHRGIKVLLRGTHLKIFPQQKVALIGANGCGKSSIFQLILGNLGLDQGHYGHPKGWRISHMAQEVESSKRSALDYVLDGHQQFRAAETAVQEAHTQGDDHALAHALATLDDLKGYQQPAIAEQLLAGLGFKPEQMSAPVSSFSGGWQIRLNLAQALIQPSDLLLLDEPTNHLDLDAAMWLEQWLQQYPGTLLLISHDRDFIDAVSDVIVHVEHQQLNRYTGNYSAFERARAEALALQQRMHEKQQQEVAHLEDFIRRFRAKASKAKQAQSRIKALERMEMISAAQVDSPFEFRFPCHDKMSDPLLVMNEAVLGYQAEKPILQQVQFSLTPGSRIGLLGHNGAGKSTLIKTLVGDLPLLEGECVAGEHLKVGYFAQHQLEALDVNASPMLHIQRISPNAREQEIRNFLGGYGFQGDRALEACGPFSGGEKARLALALVAWHKPNLLLLDEPTNHLDIEMRQALINALLQFEGALVVISHDRHLLNQTVDEFWLVHAGQVSLFEGDLQDYQSWLKQEGAEVVSGSSEGIENSAPDTVIEQNTQEARKAKKQQEAQRRARLSPLKKQLTKLEKKVEQYQQRLNSIENELADSSLYEESKKAQLKTLLADQQEIKSDLEAAEMTWFELHEEMERIEHSE